MTPKKREWKPKFIEKLGETANVSRAAEHAGVSRQAAYKERKASEQFLEAWDEAMEQAMDMLEEEARRRAYEGTLKPVYYKGEAVGEVREYSDTLMIFLLKGRRTDVFGDRVKQEITGAAGGPIRVIEVVGGDDGEEGEIS